MVFLHIKSSPNLLFGVLCLPGDQSHPFAQPSMNPLACCICWAGLLGRAVFPPWNEGPNFGSYRVRPQRLQFGVPAYNPRMHTSDIIISLQPNCKPGFLLMPFVLSWKTWTVAKSEAWVPRPPSGAQQSQDSPSPTPILSMMTAAGSHSQSLPVTLSRGSVQAG